MFSLLLAAAVALQSAPADEGILACVDINRDKQRLRCYDAAVKRDDILAAEEAAQAVAAAEALAAEQQRVQALEDELAAAAALAAEQERTRELEAQLAAAEERARAAELEASRAESLAREATKGFEPFTAEVLEVSFTARGKLVVFLSNGETWRQINSDSVAVSPQRASRVQTVEVREGAIGSRIMVVRPLGKRIRVNRIEAN